MSTEAAADATPSTTTEQMDLPTLRRFIAPLSKEQLIELLATVAIESPEVYKKTHDAVKASPASRRLMVRNVAFSTQEADFMNLFKQFGEIEDAVIVRDKDNRSRGYGFVTFKNLDSVDKALKETLTLDGRQLLSKLAADPFADFSTGTNSSSGGQSTGTPAARRKLFIRNLSDSTDSESLKTVFAAYGELEECAVVTDPAGRSRGYGFITYTSSESAIKAVQQPQRVINGRVVFVAFATPTKPKAQQMTQSGNESRRGTRYDAGAGMPGQGGVAGYGRDHYAYQRALNHQFPQYYPQYPQYFANLQMAGPGFPQGM
eukprot:GHVN01016128.1.p1 GENE.GHVN01016128.1~~GHVN01016128.1.p1  ORF type:complete len:317 (+),score=58.13 GHVN01016128.1:448-1398(+)